MLLLPRVATRYAKSLLELAVEQGVLEEVKRDINKVSQGLEVSRDLRVMLKSPVIKNDVKQKIFDQVFGEGMHVMTHKFFQIIIRKNREDLIHDIALAFIDQYKEYKHIHIVHVETASPLSDKNREEVMKILRSRTDEEIELVEDIREELIGGIVLRMRDAQLDASVKTNLARLEREFSKDLYTIKY